MSTTMTVTAICADNGAVLHSHEMTDHGWQSEAAARKSWKDRGRKLFEADAYLLDFAALAHTGVFHEITFKTAA